MWRQIYFFEQLWSSSYCNIKLELQNNTICTIFLCNDYFRLWFKTTSDICFCLVITIKISKYLHRVLSVNHYQKIKITLDDCCTFCKQEFKTFLNCEKHVHCRKACLNNFRKAIKRVGFNVNNVLFCENPVTMKTKLWSLLYRKPKQWLFVCLKQIKLDSKFQSSCICVLNSK